MLSNIATNFSQLAAVTDTNPVTAPTNPMVSVTHLAQRLYPRSSFF
jgi:hypothetical protein